MHGCGEDTLPRGAPLPAPHRSSRGGVCAAARSAALLAVALVALASLAAQAWADGVLLDREGLRRQLAESGGLIRGQRIPGHLLSLALQGSPVLFARAPGASDALILLDCTIEGPVNLLGARVPMAVTFDAVAFRGNVVWSDTRFEAPVQISHGTRFERSLNLQRAVFAGALTFGALESDPPEARALAQVDGRLMAAEATFLDDAGFAAARFAGGVTFNRATFKRDATFAHALFAGEASFDSTTFEQDADFSASAHEARTSFAATRFGGLALFSQARVPKGALLVWSEARFAQPAYFSGAEVRGRLVFEGGEFGADAAFDRINGAGVEALPPGRVLLAGVTARARLLFEDARLQALELRGDVPSAELRGLARPSVFVGPVLLARARLGLWALTGSEFMADVDARRVVIEQALRLDGASLRGALDLRDAVLGGVDVARPGTGIFAADARFHGPVRVGAEQLFGAPPAWCPICEPRLKIADADTQSLEALESALRAAGDVSRAGDLLYHRRLIEARLGAPDAWQRLCDALERWGWGYGVRPARAAAWFALLVVGCGLAYLTQVRPAGASLEPTLVALRASFMFSLRTAWSFCYGYKRARTPLFRALTVAQALLGKLLLFGFGRALANVSPLASELLAKLTGG